MRVLSCFDGIGTGYIALKDAGVEIEQYFASEIEEKSIKVATGKNKDIVEIGDIERVDVSKLGRIDLVIGGSPCQGFSRNGKHNNFKDKRSRLFYEFLRVLKEVKQENPDAVFMLENVRMKKEWQDIISQELGTEPIIINSSIHSVQARERTYWTNIKGVEQPEREKEEIKDIVESVDTSQWEIWHGIRIDPNITQQERELLSYHDGEVRVRQATKQGYIVAAEGDGINLSFPKSKTRRGRVIHGKVPTLDCQCNICFYINGAIRKPTIKELERIQHLPDDYTEGFTESERKKMIGNGWNKKTVQSIFEKITEQEEQGNE